MLESYKAELSPFAHIFGIKRFLYILYKNSLSSFIIVLTGIIFGITPILSIVYNGYISGILYSFAFTNYGYLKGVLKIFPHGIIEVTAFTISSAYGLQIGLMAIDKIRGKDITINKYILNGIKINMKIVFPLLLLAALIETYITPIISR
jgi:stage II sporulation protein M